MGIGPRFRRGWIVRDARSLETHPRVERLAGRTQTLFELVGQAPNRRVCRDWAQASWCRFRFAQAGKRYVLGYAREERGWPTSSELMSRYRMRLCAAVASSLTAQLMS